MSEEEWIEKHKVDIKNINDAVDIIELQQENQQLKEVIEELENKLNEDIQDLNNMRDGIIRPSELIKSLELYLQILDKAKEVKRCLQKK